MVSPFLIPTAIMAGVLTVVTLELVVLKPLRDGEPVLGHKLHARAKEAMRRINERLQLNDESDDDRDSEGDGENARAFEMHRFDRDRGFTSSTKLTGTRSSLQQLHGRKRSDSSELDADRTGFDESDKQTRTLYQDFHIPPTRETGVEHREHTQFTYANLYDPEEDLAPHHTIAEPHELISFDDGASVDRHGSAVSGTVATVQPAAPVPAAHTDDVPGSVQEELLASENASTSFGDRSTSEAASPEGYTSPPGWSSQLSTHSGELVCAEHLAESADWASDTHSASIGTDSYGDVHDSDIIAALPHPVGFALESQHLSLTSVQTDQISNTSIHSPNIPRAVREMRSLDDRSDASWEQLSTSSSGSDDD